MRLRRLTLVCAAGVAAVLTLGTAAGATPLTADHSHPSADSLRTLAAGVGLRIGTAVNMDELNVDTTYTGIVAGQFNTVTAENVMKWDAIEPSQGTHNYGPADQLVAFAKAHGQLVRGHTLLWHNQIPSWLTTGVTNGTIDNAALRDILHRHITDEVSHFRGKIWQWDVANEFFTDSNPSTINPNDFWISHLGAGVIADAFRWAHAADPHALLFYNDYNIAGEDGSNAKSDAVYAWVRQLRSQGVPIDGIGNQGHLDTQYGFPTLLTQDLQRYANLGLKVAITEADVRTFIETTDANQTPTDNLATFAQPYEYSQMLKACLAVRACISFTVWGAGDAGSWVPGTFMGEGYADIYDVNLKPKAAYTALQQDLTLAAKGAPHRTGAGAHS
ncbi:endo-1,4-beta-xylanase [Rugosimonospora acidiphila]|uniref:Beta-xylanase n=1 Tax=Rugosimonospora acidiphila TaxID=556531 RepID=A0ABP9SP49_9ACTN